MRPHDPGWRRSLARWLGGAAVHLLPARCFGCGSSLPRAQMLGACARCWSSLVPLAPPLCAGCGLPRVGRRGLCELCRRAPTPFDDVIAAVVYRGFARRALLRAKVERRREILPVLAEQLAAAARAGGACGAVDVVVPVPPRPLARIVRGFDPAEELAAVAAERLGLPVRRDLLRVTTAGWAPIKRLAGAARRSRAGGRIAPRKSAGGLRVLLVDDVMTTGATVGAAAGALRRTGASTVLVAVWARTPGGAL